MDRGIVRGVRFILSWLVLAVPVQAASFDCVKAQTKVERLVCDSSEISKLDEELAQSYKAALQDKAQVEAVKQAQKQWVKERNGCKDAACVKGAYEERLNALSAVGGRDEWHGTFTLSEKARGEMVSKILNKYEVKLREYEAPLMPGPYDQEGKKFCNAFLEDFKQQRGIEYTEPKFRTNDYNHPELAALRNQCPNIKWEWMAPRKCDAKSLAYWLMKDYRDNIEATQQKAEEMCATLFGKDELALYEIDFGDHRENVIYQSRTPKLDHDELDRLLRKPTKKELWADNSAWNRRTNTVMNVFFDFAWYKAYDLSRCDSNVIKGLGAAGATTTRESLKGLVRYHGNYITYSLLCLSNKDKSCGFFVSAGNPPCHFDVVQSKSTNTGSAK